MTEEIETHDTANEEARHGNREVLEAMTKRAEEAERKLAKAVALALKECPYRHGTETYGYWWQARRDDIAELKGEKP